MPPEGGGGGGGGGGGRVYRTRRHALFAWLFRVNHRSLLFISLSHSDNQSESVTKFYNSFKADVGGGGGGGGTC